MSKRALKAYLKSLSKAQLEEQILDLYHRLKEVKTFYDFTFNPNEEKLITEAKHKITKEYFPNTRKRAKARRSTAQNYFKHFTQIELDVSLLADLMLFNLETAQRYSAIWTGRPDAFYKSMGNSFYQALRHITYNGLVPKFLPRLKAIAQEAKKQNWYNWEYFEDKMEEANLL